MRRLRLLVLFPLVLAAVLLPGSGHAADPVLKARVGPGFSIVLTNAAGTRVSRIDPGTYTIEVTDLSIEHNFHLKGPGVDQRSDLDRVENVTWSVTFVDGKYTYVCDAHAGQMKGALTVGDAPTPAPATPKLKGSVGPGKRIAIKKSSGAGFKVLRAGTYKLTVKDATKADNFHILGAGVNKRTGVKFRGSKTWSLRFRQGKAYTVRSDAHKKMRRTFRVIAPLTPPPPPPAAVLG